VFGENADLTNGPKGRDFGPYCRASTKWSDSPYAISNMKSAVVISADDQRQMEVQQ
jgi:hypothetical protein